MNFTEIVEAVGKALASLHGQAGPGIFATTQVLEAGGPDPHHQGRITSDHANILALSDKVGIGVMPRRDKGFKLGWEVGAPALQTNGRPWAWASEAIMGLSTAELRGGAVCGLSGIPLPTHPLGVAARLVAPGAESAMAERKLSEVEESVWAWMAKVKTTQGYKLATFGKLLVAAKRDEEFVIGTAILNPEPRWWADMTW